MVWSERSINEIFAHGNVLLSLPHLKLALIGLVIIGALLMSSRGLLPEVPSRPKRPAVIEDSSPPDSYENVQPQLQTFGDEGK